MDWPKEKTALFDRLARKGRPGSEIQRELARAGFPTPFGTVSNRLARLRREGKAPRRAPAVPTVNLDEPPTPSQSREEFLEQRVKALEKHAKRERADTSITHAVLQAAEKYAKELALKPPPQVRPTRPKRDTGIIQEAVALYGDPHGGEVIDPEVTLGLNAYDLATFSARTKTWVSKIIELVSLQRAFSTVDRLHVVLLGDIVSGLIHEELLEGAVASVPQQTFACAYVLGQAVTELSAHFGAVEVHCAGGNHGRSGKEYKFKNPRDSYDWLTYKIAELKTIEIPNVHWHIPNAWQGTFTAMGHAIGYQHGDGGKKLPNGGYLGMPLAALMIHAMKARELWSRLGIDVELVVMGHLHYPLPLPGIIVNGTLAGETEMSTKGFMLTDRDPTDQYLFGATETHLGSFTHWMKCRSTDNGAYALP